MSYRKINVNGTKYEYVIGKTHLKIKGVGAFPIEDYGHLFDGRCECCGEGPYKEYVIYPRDVRKIILGIGK